MWNYGQGDPANEVDTDRQPSSLPLLPPRQIERGDGRIIGRALTPEASATSRLYPTGEAKSIVSDYVPAFRLYRLLF